MTYYKWLKPDRTTATYAAYAAGTAYAKEREWQSNRLLEMLKDSRPGRKEES